MTDQLSNVVFGLLLVSFIIIGIGNFGASMLNLYSRTDIQDIRTFDISNRTLAITNEMKNSIENTQITGISFIDAPAVWTVNLFNSIKLIFASLDIWSSLTSDFITHLGIATELSWILSFVTAAITLIIIFGLINRG